MEMRHSPGNRHMRTISSTLLFQDFRLPASIFFKNVDFGYEQSHKKSVSQVFAFSKTFQTKRLFDENKLPEALLVGPSGGFGEKMRVLVLLVFEIWS